ncbi:nitroreductase family protein [Phyllobacterium sp. K27]
MSATDNGATKEAVPLDCMLSALEERRSVPLPWLTQPAPTRAEVERILSIAARVPDHGALEPWRFIVVEDRAKSDLARRLSKSYAAENASGDSAQIEKACSSISETLEKSPLIVVVVSRPDPASRIPEWEQVLSAGAVCMNLLLAARASGFGAIWLTGWAAYSPAASHVLGAQVGEKIAGILHIGTPTTTPSDRRRPDMERIVTYWAPGPNTASS